MESDFQREKTREQLLGLLNPFTAVLIVATGDRVCSTKDGALDTPIPAMIDADFTLNDHLSARTTRHDNLHQYESLTEE